MRFFEDQWASPLSIFLTDAGSFLWRGSVGWRERNTASIDCRVVHKPFVAAQPSAPAARGRQHRRQRTLQVHGRTYGVSSRARRTGRGVDGRRVGHCLQPVDPVETRQRWADLECCVGEVAGCFCERCEVRGRLDPSHGQSQRESHKRLTTRRSRFLSVGPLDMWLQWGLGDAIRGIPPRGYCGNRREAS
jgi:hypothetical protein